MCTIRIVRSKRINKNTARSTINRAYECSRVERVNDLSDLARFSIQFSWKRSVKGKNFILLLLLLLVFTFSIDPSYHSSRTDNDVSLFLKCVLSVASRPFPPSPRKIALCCTKYSFLRIFMLILLRRCCRISFEFISNFTLIPQVENRCTQI